MNEKIERDFDTNQQAEAFMKSHGYAKNEDGEWVRYENVRITYSPDQKETTLEEEFEKKVELKMSKESNWITDDHLANLALGFIRLVVMEEEYAQKEIDFDYINAKASTLLTVLTGYPPNEAFDLTAMVLDLKKEELIND